MYLVPGYFLFGTAKHQGGMSISVFSFLIHQFSRYAIGMVTRAVEQTNSFQLLHTKFSHPDTSKTIDEKTENTYL